MTEETPLWVIFGGVRPDLPYVPVWAIGPATLEESVQLRAKDGAPANIITPYGLLPIQQRWLACLDHIPTRDESKALAATLEES